MINIEAESSVKKAWNQWPEETDTAYDRFVVYLKLGPERSLEKARQELGKSSGYIRQLHTWSSKYDWVARCRRYDEYVTLKVLKKREVLIDKAHARMLKLLDKALDQYEDILLLDNVIYVGEDNQKAISEKIKVAQDILDRLGINFAVEEGTPGGDVNVNQYIQNIYNRMDIQDS